MLGKALRFYENLLACNDCCAFGVDVGEAIAREICRGDFLYPAIARCCGDRAVAKVKKIKKVFANPYACFFAACHACGMPGCINRATALQHDKHENSKRPKHARQCGCW